MWRLKLQDDGPNNNRVGRPIWKFELDSTPEERAKVENARKDFLVNGRLQMPPSSDVLLRLQLLRERNFKQTVPLVGIGLGEEVTHNAATAVVKRAVQYYSALQARDGHWPAEKSGPLFFIPLLVICLYITDHLNKTFLPDSEHRREILRYIRIRQNEDGGWGSHIEGHSTMFCTALSYICVRLLGPDGCQDTPYVQRAQKWILDRGGVINIPSWGKTWLSLLGLYDWSGCNPMPPEFWPLPSFLPMHPYCRMVYMPMSYLYGKRFIMAQTPQLVSNLRDELFDPIVPYGKVNWSEARNKCAEEDLYHSHTLKQSLMLGILYHVNEPLLNYCWPFKILREKALETTMMHIHQHSNSRHISIGCVENALCMLACWAENPNSDSFRYYRTKIQDYIWVAEDGMKMQIFESQQWDTCFAVQAILASDLINLTGPTLKMAHDFIKTSLLQDNFHLSSSEGSWTFSDCTAERLKCCLLMSKLNKDNPEIVGENLDFQPQIVNFLISLQSKNGGLAAPEPVNVNRWLEFLNRTEIFVNIVTGNEYVESTSSAIQALVLFLELHPHHRLKSKIDAFIQNAVRYLEDVQLNDGSWYGNWGVCFTYGTWFALRGLVAAGKGRDDCPAIRNGCKFLISKQRNDGGWGESYSSCLDKEYVQLEGKRSNMVQTAWAMMGLIKAGQGREDARPIHRAAKLLMNSQMGNGDFPQEEMTGVFMNCMVHCASYRNIFPMWALAEYRKGISLSP